MQSSNGKKELTLTEKIEKFLYYFPHITKHESDFVEEILGWDKKTKAAFLFAKKMFEEKE
jgi:hypothetical protein